MGRSFLSASHLCSHSSSLSLVFHSVLCSPGKEVSSCPLLQALADREEANRTGKMTTIIFIRDRNQRGQEVSGYIDYAHRLKVYTCLCIYTCSENQQTSFIHVLIDVNLMQNQRSSRDTYIYVYILYIKSSLYVCTCALKCIHRYLRLIPRSACYLVYGLLIFEG